jgi:RNA polymerase-binding transcription factor DksA
MNTEKISEFKNRLEKELVQVENELGTVGVRNPENPNDWEAKETSLDVMSAPADPNEAADKMEEYTSNRAINDTLEVRYNNIKRAIEKIDDGTYGTCEICHQHIEEDRLDANPAARTCTAHKEKDSSLA